MEVMETELVECLAVLQCCRCSGRVAKADGIVEYEEAVEEAMQKHMEGAALCIDGARRGEFQIWLSGGGRA
jgi:hypothetical protein